MPPSGTPENSNSPPLRRDDPASQNLLSGVQWIRDAGGRVIQIRAKGRTLSGEAFARRLGALVGYGRFPSAHFTVSQMGGGEIVFQGRGKGHGVGLCQRGASELAREGADFRAILRHYFPKAGVISVYSMYDCLTGDNKCNKKK